MQNLIFTLIVSLGILLPDLFLGHILKAISYAVPLPHLAGVVSLATLLSPDLLLGYIFKILTSIPLTNLLGVIAFSATLSFVRNRWALAVVVGLIILTQTIQVNHWAYFGAPIHSQDISKAFVELDEITQTGASLAHQLWSVWLVLMASFGLVISGIIYTKKRKQLLFAWVLIVLALGITPVLAHIKGPSSFYTKPTYTTIYNSVRAFSDWIVHSKSTVKSHDYKPYTVAYSAPKVKNVVLIMGESLSSRYMHLYGYNQPNTPYLDSLKNNPNFAYAKGVSSSVSTRTCLQLFFNTFHNPGFVECIRKKDANLFRLARHQGYKTFVLSAQNEKLFHDTGTEFVDVFASEKEMHNALTQRGDEALLDAMAALELSDKNFIVIHLRHIHCPFGAYAKYHPELGMAVDHQNRASETQQEYSNAIAYHDYWVKQCIERVQKILPADTVVLFTSDHGQLLGERGLFGHNQMQPEVADVPIWALTIGADTALIAPLKNHPIYSHYHLGKHIASLLGATISNPNEHPTLQYVHGSEIYSAYEYMPWEKSAQGVAFLENRWVG